jgi:hypothetical protein
MSKAKAEELWKHFNRCIIPQTLAKQKETVEKRP